MTKEIKREDLQVVAYLPCCSCGSPTSTVALVKEVLYPYCPKCATPKDFIKAHDQSKSFFDHNVPVVLALACGHKCWKGQEVLVPVFNPEDEEGTRNWKYKQPFCIDCADKLLEKVPDFNQHSIQEY